jgi:hypothetical protein
MSVVAGAFDGLDIRPWPVDALDRLSIGSPHRLAQGRSVLLGDHPLFEHARNRSRRLFCRRFGVGLRRCSARVRRRVGAHRCSLHRHKYFSYLAILAGVHSHPSLGATIGDLLTKPYAHGGFNLGRISSSLVIAIFIVVFILCTSQRSGGHPGERGR